MGYDVYRSSSSDGTYERLPGAEGRSFTTGLTSYVDSNLTGGQRYYYKVRSVGAAGASSELSGFVGATSLADDRAPGAPSSVSAVALETAGEVVVRWSAPQTDAGGEPLSGLSGYVILRSEGAGGAVPVDTLAAGVQEYRDTGLKSRTSYSYSVLAFDGSGNVSPASALGVGDVVGSVGAFGSAGHLGDRPDRAELGLGGRVVAGGLRRVSLVVVGRQRMSGCRGRRGGPSRRA